MAFGPLGEGFWVTLGALGRAFGSPYCPKAPRTETDTKSVKVGRSLGYPKEPQNDSFPMKPQRQVEFKEEITAQRIVAKNIIFKRILSRS